MRIDYRADAARIRVYAQELLDLKPDVFLVSTALVLQPLQQLTRDIPIIFTRIIDPVGSGFVASLAHPGGNITGFTPAEFSMYGKPLEVLKEAAAHVTCVAVMLNRSKTSVGDVASGRSCGTNPQGAVDEGQGAQRR